VGAGGRGGRRMSRGKLGRGEGVQRKVFILKGKLVLNGIYGESQDMLSLRKDVGVSENQPFARP